MLVLLGGADVAVLEGVQLIERFATARVRGVRHGAATQRAHTRALFVHTEGTQKQYTLRRQGVRPRRGRRDSSVRLGRERAREALARVRDRQRVAHRCATHTAHHDRSGATHLLCVVRLLILWMANGNVRMSFKTFEAFFWGGKEE